MINKKRGNIFENLTEFEDEEAADSGQDGRPSGQSKGDFRDLELRLDGIQKDSSEVMETLRKLRIQIEEIKTYFEEDFDEDDEVFDIDTKYFRLAFLDLHDESQDLFPDNENEVKIRREKRKIAQTAKELMQIIIQKRENQEDQTYLEDDDHRQGDRPSQEGGEPGREGADEHSRRQQKRPDGGHDVSEGGTDLYKHNDQTPSNDGHPEIQEMVRGARYVPLGHEGDGGLQERTWTAPTPSRGAANCKAGGYEDSRGSRCPERSKVQVRGRHDQALQSPDPGRGDDKEEADGAVDGEDDEDEDGDILHEYVMSNDSIQNTLVTIFNICDYYMYYVFLKPGLPEGGKRYDKDKQECDTVTISDTKAMTKIPSKCPTCKAELPSINALKEHKKQAHPTPSKPPGPSMKAKDAVKKKGNTPGKPPVVVTVSKNNALDVNVNVAAPTTTGTAPKVTITPRLNNSPGSVEVMNRWMAGSTRSNAIAAALANSASAEDEARDQPAPTLDESINLLATLHPGSSTDTPGPRVSTLRVFPPEMEAVPILEEGGGYILRQNMTQDESGILSERGEKEKGKRNRERYEDEGSLSGKKFDEKSTPEERRIEANKALNPRNLSRELLENESEDVLDTMEVMEVEFDSQDPWDIEGQNVNLVSLSEAPSNIEDEAGRAELSVASNNVAPSREELSVAGRLMTTSERNWMNSATFSSIPPSPQEANNTTRYGDDTHDVLYFKNSKIDELTVKLAEALSDNQDHQEKMGDLENKIMDLEAGVKHYRDMAEKVNSNAAETCSKLQSDIDILRKQVKEKDESLMIKKAEIDSMNAEVERLKRDVEEKAVLVDSAALELESVKTDSMEAMHQIKSHVTRIELQARLDKEKAMRVEKELTDNLAMAEAQERITKENAEKLEKELNDKMTKILGEKRAEGEKLHAVNRKSLSEIKMLQDERRQLQVKCDQVTEVRAALVKAEGERDFERLKAEKSEDMLKKMEDIVKGAQEERGRKEFRISALEHSNKILTRSQPCDKQPGTCDFTCGKDHHCGTPTIKTRRRSRSRGQNNSEVQTVANLASQAGVPVNRMQQLVDDQAQAQTVSHGSHQGPVQDRAPARYPPKPSHVSGGVQLCRDYHYLKVCVRGLDCKFAHEIFPANARKPQVQAMGGARALNNALGGIQRQAAAQTHNQSSKPRSRSASTDGRRFVTPAYNPEHPDYEVFMANQASQVNRANNLSNPAMVSGNATEQSHGASAAQKVEPQVVKPQLMRPRAASSSVASDALEARRTVQETMAQQASNQARMRGLKNKAWKESLDSVVNLISNTYTTSVDDRRSSSAETPDSSAARE